MDEFQVLTYEMGNMSLDFCFLYHSCWGGEEFPFKILLNSSHYLLNLFKKENEYIIWGTHKVCCQMAKDVK